MKIRNLLCVFLLNGIFISAYATGHGSNHAVKNGDTTLTKTSVTAITLLWSYNFHSNVTRMEYGSSPAVRNLGPQVNNLGNEPDNFMEIVTGSDEYSNFFPELNSQAYGLWRCFDALGNLEWVRDTKSDEARTSPAITDINDDLNPEIATGTTSGWCVEVMDRFGSWTPGVSDAAWTFPYAPQRSGSFMWHSSPAVGELASGPHLQGKEVVDGNNYLGSIWAFDGDNSDGIDDGITVDLTGWGYPGPTGTEGVDWDVLWVFQTSGSIIASPAIGDVDNDGQNEVLVGSKNHVFYCINGANGSQKWSLTTNDLITGSAGMADFDNNGKLEVIFGSQDGNVYFIKGDENGNGTIDSAEFAYFATGAAVYSSPAIADVDNDGSLEVIIGSDNGYIYCFSYSPVTNSVTVKWQYLTNGPVRCSPAIAYSGRPTLTIYAGSGDGTFYLINGLGGLINSYATGGSGIVTSPAVADINGDNKLEIVFTAMGSPDVLLVLSDDGSNVLPFAHPWPMFRHDEGHTGFLNWAPVLYSNDVGVPSQISPPTLVTNGATVIPKALVHNYGTSPQSGFTVTFEIYNDIHTLIYNNTQTVGSLAPGANVIMAFDPFVAYPGTFETKAFTTLTGDQNPDNDTLEEEFYVLQPEWVDHLEDGNGGLLPDPVNNGWEYGTPVYGPGPASAHSGNNCWGTNLTGDYDNSADWKLISQYYLAQQNYPVLSFWHWYSIEKNRDGGVVRISVNGTTYIPISPIGGYPGIAIWNIPAIADLPCFNGNSEGWELVSFILPVQSGDVFRIMWQLGSDNINTFPGWYIDDIQGIGFIRSNTISGTKFIDLNNNGVKDPSETGLQGWTINFVGQENLSMMTNAQGNYLITGFADGDYTVSEQAQPFWNQTYPPLPGTYSFSFSGGQLIENVNFGNHPDSAAICGFKYHDLNGNGVWDQNETGLPGWPIYASGPFGSYSTVTDESGNYCFFDLLPGNYSVYEGYQSGWSQTSFPYEYFFNLGPGQTVGDINFGNMQPGSICGMKFMDQNNNGSFDQGEPGLSYWQIHLEGPVTTTIYTDYYGQYCFNSLPPGEYTVSEIMLPGWTQTMPVSGTYNISLAEGASINDINFGNFATVGSICGNKYNDQNGNGIKDANEPGIQGWTIYLQGPDGNQSAITDPAGDYCFENLFPGVYYVWETYTPPWIQTSTPSTYTLQIGSGENIANIDFGNLLPGSVCGAKFNDSNNDGIRDPDELGLFGWQIVLSGAVNTYTFTDLYGNYCFNNLPQGNYTVSEVQVTGWAQTSPPSPGTYNFNLEEGQGVTGIDFGNHVITGSICGSKYNDLNGDGIWQTDEPGIENWTIYLSDIAGYVSAVATNADGSYCFENLLPGYYSVWENADMPSWIQTTLPIIYNLELAENQPISGVDFGNYYSPPAELSICGAKYKDINGDGFRQADEPGIEGWLINLYGPSGQTYTFTDASGDYCFDNLVTGSYEVWENNGEPVWTQTGGQSTYYLQLVENQPISGVDFGNHFNQTQSICGFKYSDLNSNGIWDEGEPGVGGWTIYLSDAAGYVYSTTTNIDGSYCFENLLPGYYSVWEYTDLPGWTQTSSPAVYELYLVENQPILSINFGNHYLQTQSICGYKFNDLNSNGHWSEGEYGIDNWTIYLSDANGNVYTTLTNADGSYCFEDLPPGYYSVWENTDVPGWTQTSSPAIYYLDLVEGQHINDAGFGNHFNTNQTICGSKYNDLNSNGLWDAGEPGIEGWVINLYGPSGQSYAFTDASGNYCFEDLEPGSYEVWENNGEPVWTQTGGQSTYYLQLVENQPISGVDFGNHFIQTQSICGSKYSDLNSNGLWDAGEPGVEGWTIYLSNAAGDVYGVVTNADGSYCFDNLYPGSYTVWEYSDMPGWIQTSSPVTYYLDLVENQPITAIDFGNHFIQTQSICGSKYSDLNSNGLWDAGEPGIEGWTIYLSDAPGYVNYAITNADGSYCFDNLLPGSYNVWEDNGVTGWIQTSSPVTYYLDLVENQPITAINFGNHFIQTQSICGYKFSDENSNGLWDEGEQAVQNWTIYLSDAEGYTYESYTNYDGSYCFDNLLPGSYAVWEYADYPGWVQTSSPDVYYLDLFEGQPASEINFGNHYTPPANLTICGAKYNDLNGDGSRQANEPGIEGWVINLYGPDGQSYIFTDANGDYCFENLGTGLYEIWENNGEPLWTQTGGQSTYYLELVENQPISGVDFGNHFLQNQSICGSKFSDLNGDGIWQADEPGLENWTIYLGDNQGYVTYAVTSADGSYCFENLLPGSYAVWEENGIPNGTQTSTPITYYLELVDNQPITEINFGNFYSPPANLSICGSKYRDLNGDGIWQTDEPGLENWTIYLQDAAGIVYYAITGADGSYCFENLLPGSYAVWEYSDLPGWTQTSSPITYYLDLVEGQPITGINFGNFFTPPGNLSICGSKYNDLNGDGIWQADEPGIENWIIYLSDIGGYVTATVTGADGSYCFENLAPALYTVWEYGDTPGWTLTSIPSTYYLELVENQPISGVNFGNHYSPPVYQNICGSKYNDLNGDGIWQANEPGLENWTIYLSDVGGYVTSVSTAADGSYCFDDLLPGYYNVWEDTDNMPGWIQTSTPVVYELNLVEGQNIAEIDFGNHLIPTQTLCGTKYNDMNGNGMRDAGEPGIPDWMIFMTEGSTVWFTYTNAEGLYCFDNVYPGSYEVYEASGDPDWIQTSVPATYNILIAENQNVNGIDFGNHLIDQAVTTAGSIQVCQGESISIPIEEENLNYVGSMSLTLNFDNTLLTYTGYTNLNPYFYGGDLQINQAGGQFQLTWLSTIPVNFELYSPVLLNLVFVASPGYSEITWDLTPGACEYKDTSGTVIPSLFVNGSVEILPPLVVLCPQDIQVIVNAQPFDLPAGIPGGGTFSGPGVIANVFYPDIVGVGDYVITYSYTNPNTGCFGSCEFTIHVIPATSTISGFVRYANPVGTPMTNTNIDLKLGGSLVNTDITDASGSYGFTDVLLGYYRLVGHTSKPWGGVNATDALRAAQYFVGMIPTPVPPNPDTLYVRAADVNGSGYVNTVDALLILQRFAGVITSFPVGDWLFARPLINISTPGDYTANFKAVCFGDVNGSYTPPLKMEPSVFLQKKGMVSADLSEEFWLPVTVDQDLTTSAISLVMQYPDNVTILDVIPGHADLGTMLFTAGNGILRIGWYSINPMVLSKDEIILKMKVRVDHEQDGSFNVLPESVISDNKGFDYNMVNLNIPGLIMGEENGYMLNHNIPNPFEGTTRISWSIPETGQVSLKVYDVLGREVATLVDHEVQTEGVHAVEFHCAYCPDGVYMYKLDVQGTTSSYSKTMRMVIRK
ncbi:MAG: FG-GAP-like repeat-containing protein [Bacteroidetes bacterium]|nr:FG-GAP-like repeat-containing protein [Bacteroidota bacterium]